MGNPTGFIRSPLQQPPYSPEGGMPQGIGGVKPQGMSGSGGLNIANQIQPFTPTTPVTAPQMPQYSQPGSFNTGTQRMGIALGRFGRG